MSNSPQCFAMQKKLAEVTQQYYDSVYERGATHKQTNRLLNLKLQMEMDIGRLCGNYNPTPTQAAEDAKAGGLFTPKQNALSGLKPGAAQPVAPPAYSGMTLRKTPSAFGKAGF